MLRLETVNIEQRLKKKNYHRRSSIATKLNLKEESTVRKLTLNTLSLNAIEFKTVIKYTSTISSGGKK